jgi:hypothetical protein
VTWQFFEWQSTIPAGTSVAFSAQTMATSTGTWSPTTPLGIGTASATTGAGVWAHGTSTVNQVLTSATPALTSQAYLLVSMQFNPNTSGTPAAPSLLAWQQLYDCTPNQ